MLVLRRQKDEGIVIGNVLLTVVDIRGDKVRLGIDAPSDVSVLRGEVYEEVRRIDGAHAASDVEVEDDGA